MSVLITGATGFIALHIIQQLLEQGYKVIGTVRSEAKGEDLLTKFNNANFSYAVVSTLVDYDQFVPVFENNKDIEIVIHTASGVSITNEIEKCIRDPAVKGTTNILRAIKEHAPQLKNFIYTSSVGAIVSPGSEAKGIFRDESTWNNTTWEQSKGHPISAYCNAKTQAEKSVWEFFKDSKINATTINPGFVFGPQVFKESVSTTLNQSNELITTVLKDGENYNKVEGHCIDVRDVAKAHIYAFTKPETFGKRLILIHDYFTEQTLIDIINQEFPALQGKITKGDEQRKKELVWADKNVINSDKSKEILGFKYITLEKSLKDTVQQILDAKVLKHLE